MIDKAVIANPRTKYGSGRGATRHFITQRLTGALNIGFTGFLIWLVFRLAGATHPEFIGIVGNPVVAILLAILIVNVVIHMRIGMREVIEDYVHDERVNRLSRLLSNFFGLAIIVLAWGALAKIAFWG
ncbi:MAG: hypothetical protein JWR75_1708 [Devosia sp.]|nr:hypothetical protein [Devosia sp.]